MTIKDVSNNKGPAVTAVESLESLVISSVLISVVSDDVSLASDEDVDSGVIVVIFVDPLVEETVASVVRLEEEVSAVLIELLELG